MYSVHWATETTYIIKKKVVLQTEYRSVVLAINHYRMLPYVFIFYYFRNFVVFSSRCFCMVIMFQLCHFLKSLSFSTSSTYYFRITP